MKEIFEIYRSGGHKKAAGIIRPGALWVFIKAAPITQFCVSGMRIDSYTAVDTECRWTPQREIGTWSICVPDREKVDMPAPFCKDNVKAVLQ